MADAKPTSRHQRPDGTPGHLLLSLAFLAALAVAAWTAAMGPGPAAASSTAASVGLNTQPGPQPLVITLSRAPQTVHDFTLREPDRLVLDITPASLPGNRRNLPSSNPLIKGVRAAQRDTDTVRVVLDLKYPAAYRIASRPAADGNPHTLVVTLPDTAQGEASSGSPAPDAATQGERALPTPSGGPTQAQAPPEQPARTPEKSDAPAAKTILRFDAPAPGMAAPAAPHPGAEPAAAGEGGKPSTRGALDLSGFLRSKGTQQFHESGYPEQARMFRGTAHVEGKWTPPFTSGEHGDTATTYLLGSLRTEYLSFGPEPPSDDRDLELWEGYVYHSAPGWDMRVGRQIVRWGKTDQISPVDNLNPQDMREFLIPELEDRKIPNWMARARAFPDDAGPLGAIALEAVFIPFFKENEFDWTGNTWSLLGVETPDLPIDEDSPGRGLDNSDYGLRAAATVSGWDMAVSWLATTEKTPHLRLDLFNPAGPTLQADYGRQNIFGFEFETALDTFGFRGEAAYFDRQSFNTADFDPASSPVFYWVLGLDYIGEGDWYANLQFSHQHLFEYDEDTLFLQRDNFYLNGEVNKELWRGNLTLRLRYAVDIQDGGSFFTPEVILTYFSNLEIALGANMFFGPDDSFLGRYHDNNQAFLKATYRF